ncbi:MAG: hypothetical protein DME25_10885 [Verrucomicrobia bacterium]|nr:MAG: hypothetical protein DME25_10885 [Verrucomicrobiota bacterium]
MHWEVIGYRKIVATLAAIVSLLTAPRAFGVGAWLQGQNSGDTNTWTSVNLQGWVELDYVPFRVYFDPGSSGLQTITVDFPHLNGTMPGFEDLTGFNPFTTNVVFTSPPTLTTDPSGVWRYTFTVNVLNNNPAEVRFFARLAAGAHLNPGSSLQLRSSAGNVQIHKPAPCPDQQDLAIAKTGPANALPGATINYTLTYTNRTGTNIAHGVQICDILPAQVVVLTNTLSANTHCVGNTIFWDLGNLGPHASGTITLQVQIDSAIADLTVLTNFVEILNCGDDLNMADNASTWLTTVCAQPGVTTGPASAARCPGQAVTFTVSASGSAPLNYQWRKNGSNLAGATASLYSIGSVSTADAGSYDVVVGNACGTATSGAATLTVSQTVTISSAPANSTNCAGTSASFSVAASGTGLTYQWAHDGSPIAGATTSTLNLVVVSAACGAPRTNSATLVVNAPAVISTAPSSQTNCAGTSASFSVAASGTGLTYQWAHDGSPIAGATTSTLNLNNVQSADAGRYDVVVSAACGAPQTNGASLVVNSPILVTTPPTSQTNCAGTSASFSVAASGTGLTYQWAHDGSPIAGATASSLSLNNVQSADAGKYGARHRRTARHW